MTTFTNPILRNRDPQPRLHADLQSRPRVHRGAPSFRGCPLVGGSCDRRGRWHWIPGSAPAVPAWPNGCRVLAGGGAAAEGARDAASETGRRPQGSPSGVVRRPCCGSPNPPASQGALEPGVSVSGGRGAAASGKGCGGPGLFLARVCPCFQRFAEVGLER